MKRCQSCGRLIELLEDFAGLDQSSIYCSSCADGSGKLRTFEEVLENLTQRIAKTDGFDEQASRNAALQILGRQPAWEPKFIREEGMKTNKKRLLMITVAAIFAITAGGVTWWLTSKYYQDQNKSYEIHVANGDNPFKNIQTTKKDGYTFKEFRCKGDQKITELKNGLLKLDSYSDYDTGGGFSYNSTDLTVDDYEFHTNVYKPYKSNIYEYNIYNNKFNIDNKRYRIAFYKDLTKQNGVIEINLSTYKDKHYNFVNTAQTHIRMNYNNYNYVDENVCNNEVLFSDGNTSIELFPEKSNRIISERRIYIFNKNKKIREITVPNYDCLISCEMASSKYVIIYVNGMYLIVDIMSFHTRNLYYINRVYVFNDVVLYVDRQNKLMKFNFETSTSEMLYQMTNNSSLLSYYDKDNRSFLIVQNDAGNIRKIDLITKKIANINIQNYKVIPIFVGKYVLSCEKNKFEISNAYTMFDCDNDLIGVDSEYVYRDIKKEVVARVENTCKIFITNLETNKMTLLDDKFTGELTIDGNFIAWTRNAGPKDNQWKNVCFTKLP